MNFFQSSSFGEEIVLPPPRPGQNLLRQIESALEQPETSNPATDIQNDSTNPRRISLASETRTSGETQPSFNYPLPAVSNFEITAPVSTIPVPNARNSQTMQLMSNNSVRASNTISSVLNPGGNRRRIRFPSISGSRVQSSGSSQIRSVQNSFVSTPTTVTSPPAESSTYTETSRETTPSENFGNHATASVVETSLTSDRQLEFDSNLQGCLDEVRSVEFLSSFALPSDRNNTRRLKRKSGPPKKTVKIKVYHCPPDEDLPYFNSDKNGVDPKLIEHRRRGYGFPVCCFNETTQKSKFTSISIHLNGRQFRETLCEWCPNLNVETEIMFYKISQNRKIERFFIESSIDLLNSGYRGVIIVKSGTQSPTQVPRFAGVRQNASTRLAQTLLPSSTPQSRFVSPRQNPTTPLLQNPFQSSLHHQLIAASRNTVSRQQSIIDQSTTSVQQLPAGLPYNSINPTSTSLTSSSSEVSNSLNSWRNRFSLETSSNTGIDPKSYIDSIRYKFLGEMSETQELLIDCQNILEDATNFYSSDISILSCTLRVKFQGEVGEDVDGLTRDFFSSFWYVFLKVYGSGEKLRYFVLNCNQDISPNVFIAAGRIMFHGFILTGYLPPFLNPTISFYMLTRKFPSQLQVANSFLFSFCESEREVIKTAISGSISDSAKLRLAEIFSGAGMSSFYELYNNFSGFFNTFSFFKTFVQPFYIYHHSSTTPLDIEETHFFKYADKASPSGELLSKVLEVKYTADEYRGLEDLVFGYLERYVGNLSQCEAYKFTKFATGAELMPSQLFIIFNGNINPELMIPVSHTCSGEFELSRHITSYEHLKVILDNVMANVDICSGFHLI